MQDADNNLVDHLIIPSPCSVGWDNMSGNDEVRFCKGCETNVYNLSAVSKKRGSYLVSSGKAKCARMGRLANGTVVTDECPRWFKPVRHGWKMIAKTAVSILTLLVVLPSAQSKERAHHSKKTETSVQQNATGETSSADKSASGLDETEVAKSKSDSAKSQTKPSEAELPKPNPKDINLFYVEGTVIDERHYVKGRDVRHQKTSPTLPQGSPIPDNE